MLTKVQKTRTHVHFWAYRMLELLWERGQQFSKNLVMWLGDSPSKCTSGHLSERNGNCLLPLWDIWKWLYFRNEEQISSCQRLENRSGVGGEGGRFVRELLTGGVLKRAEGGILAALKLFGVCTVVLRTQTHTGPTVNRAKYTQLTDIQIHATYSDTDTACMHTPPNTHTHSTYTYMCINTHINRHITHTYINHKYTHIQTHTYKHRYTTHTCTNHRYIHTHTHKQTHHMRTHICCGNSSVDWKRISRHRGSEFIKSKKQR